MAQIEDEIVAAGGQIVWVLEEDTSYQPGTATGCHELVRSKGSARGLCVGDAETEPYAGAFRDSPLSGRGLDLIVTREDMVVRWAASHAPADALIAQVRALSGR